MSVFVDYCTTNTCGEPATTWLASSPGEAFCPTHTPTTSPGGARWVSCPLCAFQYRDSEHDRIIDHLVGHVHAVTDQATVEAVHRRQVLATAATFTDALTRAAAHLTGTANDLTTAAATIDGITR